jgi:mono/diheme cytochrome c family protein
MSLARSLISLVGFLLIVCFTDSGNGRIRASKQETSPAQSVSYSRQIKPLLAIRCSGCHGPDPWWAEPYQHGFDVTSYESLIKGGDAGAEILPGQPDASRMVHYIRDPGPKRMPFVGAPLSPSQIQLISTWIKEGAKQDHADLPSVHILLDDVQLIKDKKKDDAEFPYEDIVCRIPVESYATIIISDPATGKVLSKRGGPVQRVHGRDRDLGSAASTEGWLFWSLSGFRDNNAPKVKLPDVVSIELVIEDFDQMPWGAEFGISRDSLKNQRSNAPRQSSVFLPEPISLKNNQSGQFTYRLDGDADVDIGIVDILKQRGPLVFKDHQSDLKEGQKTYPWNLRDTQGNRVSAGGYVARFRSTTRNSDIPVNDVCVVFQVLP